jgi:hypothetical protein
MLIDEGAVEKIRPIVTAGLANAVDEVNRCPANIHRATDAATKSSFAN